MLLPMGSTSSGAPYSRGGVISARPMSPGGKFPSYAMIRSYMVLPN